MKLLKAGTPQPPPGPPWWVGKVATCTVCKAVVEYENGDPVAEPHIRHATTPCPTEHCRGFLRAKHED